jgi:D-amino-acid oxidase
LLEHYQADAIVDASGLGATEAAADPSVYGLHSALLCVVNDGSDFPIVENIMVVSSTKSSSSRGEGAFLLPRKDNILALSTISKAMGGAADLTIDSPEVREMRSLCEDLLPCLKNARLDPLYPIVQGTRP